MKTTRIAQYAALAANNSCRAAFVSRLIAALNSSVKTIKTPTALNVSLLLVSIALEEAAVLLVVESGPAVCDGVDVSWYMVMTGTTSRMKMTRVISMLMSLSMRVEL